MYMDIILYHNTHEELKLNTSQTPYATYSWSLYFQSDIKSRNIWQVGIQTYILPIEHSKTLKVHSIATRLTFSTTDKHCDMYSCMYKII